MISTKKVLASAVTASVLALGSVTAQAGAIAQSILDISDFRIAASNPAAISGFGGGNSGDVDAGLGALSASDSANPFDFSSFALSECVGSGCGSYLPGTQLVPLGSEPVATYAGSASEVSGDALVASGSSALIDNTVSIMGSNGGTSGSNVGLLASFTISVAQESSLIFGFNADPFLRAFVGPEGMGTSETAINWVLSITDDSGEIFGWSGGNTVDGGTLLNSACSINATRSQFGAGEKFYDPLCSSTVDVFGDGEQYGFGAASDELGPGTYQVSIRQTGSADANFVSVPVPGTLALIGTGLLGVAGLRRRQRRVA